MPSVEIKHPDVNSGNKIEIAANRVQPDFNKSVDSQPEINNWALREIQDLSSENVSFVISGFLKENKSGYFGWSDLLALYKSQYTGSNQINLYVNYANGSTLTGVEGSSPIKTVLTNVSGVSLEINQDKDLSTIPFEMTLTETK